MTHWFDRLLIDGNIMVIDVNLESSDHELKSTIWIPRSPGSRDFLARQCPLIPLTILSVTQATIFQESHWVQLLQVGTKRTWWKGICMGWGYACNEAPKLNSLAPCQTLI